MSTAHNSEKLTSAPYGPMLNAIQDMWDEHDQRAQGSCGCAACKTAIDFFTACCEVGETKR